MIQIDMDMPKNCKFCPLHDVNPDQCPIRTIYKDDYATSRFTDCPLYKIAEDTDTISRQAAVEACYNGWNKDYRGIAQDIKDLPPAQPETHDKRTETHACDLISRQAAIEALDVGAELLRRVLDDADIVGAERAKYEWGLGLIEAYISDMKDLPSAQPKIIHCGECRYKDDGIDEDGIPFLKCLHGRSYGGTRINDFCSWAERRADDRIQGI